MTGQLQGRAKLNSLSLGHISAFVLLKFDDCDMAAVAGKPLEKIILLQSIPPVMQGGELDKIIAGHGGGLPFASKTSTRLNPEGEEK